MKLVVWKNHLGRRILYRSLDRSKKNMQEKKSRNLVEDTFRIDYVDVAVSVNKDPRLEALHDNVPYQITAEEALRRRAALLKKHNFHPS